MNLIQRLALAGTIVASTLPATAKDLPTNKIGFPTAEGVEMYVNKYDSKVKRQFKRQFNAKFKDLNIGTKYIEKDYGKYDTDPDVDSTYISTAKQFTAYEMESLSPQAKEALKEANVTVKGRMIHEMAHDYTCQIIDEMLEENYNIHSTMHRNSAGLSYNIIREGIAQYCAEKMGEVILMKKEDCAPKSLEYLTSPERDTWDLQYQYGYYFVEPILNELGLKEGIEKIVSAKGPMMTELCNPEVYYKRILQ